MVGGLKLRKYCLTQACRTQVPNWKWLDSNTKGLTYIPQVLKYILQSASICQPANLVTLEEYSGTWHASTCIEFNPPMLQSFTQYI